MLLVILFWLGIVLEGAAFCYGLRVPRDLAHLPGSREGRVLPNPKVYRCGNIGKEMVLNFVNNGYPSDDVAAGDCSFRLVIHSHDICQVRVDLVDTELLSPSRGECLSQTLTVEGQVWPTGLPPICGANNDQHFYLHLEPWSGNTSLVDFKISTVPRDKAYRFGIWITQIDCAISNVLRAPAGCTQYFLSETGTIKSFNFEGSQYFGSQNYKICIRSGRGVCGIRYDAAPQDFRIRKAVPGNKKDLLLRSGVGPAVCRKDFLLIPDAQDSLNRLGRSGNGRLLFGRRRQPPQPAKKKTTTTAPQNLIKRKGLESMKTLSQDRFCGGRLSPTGGDGNNKPVFAEVRSNLITLRFKTSFTEEGNKVTKGFNNTAGFHLKYSQLKTCSTDQGSDMVSRTPRESLLRKPEGKGNLTLLAGASEEDEEDGDSSLWEYLDEGEEDLYDYLS